MQPRRVRGFAAVCASGVAAGIIDSRNGSATLTPTPWRNVRRDRWFLVMKDMCSLPTLRTLHHGGRGGRGGYSNNPPCPPCPPWWLVSRSARCCHLFHL